MTPERRYIVFIALMISLPCFLPVYSLDYFGLEEPGTTPKSFNPSILNLNSSFIFNAIYNIPDCNEFYFTKVELKENIYFSKNVNGAWQPPQLASFSVKDYHDADPFFALEGNRVYFISSRPTHSADKKYDYNIWYADRIETGWGKPIVLPEPINTPYEEYFFSISNKGNAFFASNRPKGYGSFDIYKLKLMPDGSMSDPINIGEPVNTEKYEFDPYISPDESFIIFDSDEHPGGYGEDDLYVCFRIRTALGVKPLIWVIK